MEAASYCTLLVSQDKVVMPSHAEVQADLESPDVARKVGAVKKCILMILNGEDMSKLLMTVIRFCITVEDHELKKLLVYFWECVKKYDASGHLKPEMILVWYVEAGRATSSGGRVGGHPSAVTPTMPAPMAASPRVPACLCASTVLCVA